MLMAGQENNLCNSIHTILACIVCKKSRFYLPCVAPSWGSTLDPPTRLLIFLVIFPTSFNINSSGLSCSLLRDSRAGTLARAADWNCKESEIIELLLTLFLTMGFMMTRMMAFQRMEVLANWRGMTVKERGMDSVNPNIGARERTA